MKAIYKHPENHHLLGESCDNIMPEQTKANEGSIIMPANDDLWSTLDIGAEEWEAASENGFLIY